MPQAAKRRARSARLELYRQLVLEAAEQVFAAKGYDDAKMEEIAARAGLSLQTLYSACAGKADIHRAIHEAGDAELLARATEAARGADGALAALLAGVRAYTGYFLERPDFLRMHLQEGFSWGTERAGARSQGRTAAWREGIDMMTAAFQRGIDEGRLVPGDPRLMARTTIAMQQVRLAHWLEGGMEEDPAAVLEDIEAQVLRSFARGAEDG